MKSPNPVVREAEKLSLINEKKNIIRGPIAQKHSNLHLILDVFLSALVPEFGEKPLHQWTEGTCGY